MKVYANQLSAHLAKNGLASVFLVTGDEPLQLAECCDAIREQARTQGFSGREVMHVEGGFDWNQLAQEANAMSLFAEQRILELRLANAKPGTQGAKALMEYCENPSPDNILLITLGKLESAASKSKWYKALDQRGVVVQIWPVERGQLPRWIQQRMAKISLQPGPEVAEMLAERVEGNLLAAAQEIEKLRLLYGEGGISARQLLDAVADSARYDVFGLVDAALQGDAPRVAKMLDGLRGEGEEPILILWALTREIRTLTAIAYEAHQGGVSDSLLGRHRVWDKRKPLVRQALQRHSYPRWVRMLEQAGQIDRIVKGQAPGNAWDELVQLTLLIAGVRLPRAEGI